MIQQYKQPNRSLTLEGWCDRAQCFGHVRVPNVSHGYGMYHYLVCSTCAVGRERLVWFCFEFLQSLISSAPILLLLAVCCCFASCCSAAAQCCIRSPVLLLPRTFSYNVLAELRIIHSVFSAAPDFARNCYLASPRSAYGCCSCFLPYCWVLLARRFDVLRAT